MNYFVTAIGTDSGKTVVSAILCEALGADYWKPVQAGAPYDTDGVKSLVSNPAITFHPEAYQLTVPASPHAAAKADGVTLQLNQMVCPAVKGDLIIEGAGGCLVPLNDTDFVIDIAGQFNATIILVANLYLGSINHTLLTVEALRARNLPIKGIIFNGERNPDSEQIILKHSALPALLHIEQEKEITQETIRSYAALLKTKTIWHA